MRAHATYLSLSLAMAAVNAPAQTAATVNINTAQTTPLNPGFSGFNYEGATSYEPYDYQFNAAASQLSPGWIRYPGGIASDAFSWQTGLINTSWVNHFSSTQFAGTLSSSISEFAGKGGQQFLDVGRQALFLGAKIIVDVNAYTDTPQSIGAMAAFAKANNIPVAVWELCNEAYFFEPLFFQNGADYAAQMLPFRNAIKAADPNAIVSLFFSDPATQMPKWDKSLASYTTPYWDAITYHFYGQQSSGTSFAQWMADENANLVNYGATYITSYAAPLNPPGTMFVISEFNPTGGDLGQNPGLTDGTLYGGIYAAEYIMRMSTVPSLLYVGMHALSSDYGINANNRHFNDVQNAYTANTTIDTATLTYGFFPSAQAEGVAILNGVLRNAAQVDATTLTGGATVAATGLGQIPALYAQAYTSNAGSQSLVIANKSAVAHQVTVELNGAPVAGVLPVQFITASDPSTTNNSTTDSPISIQTLNSANPVSVPAYSVVRVDLNGGATIQTSPPGLQFTVDGGAAQTATQTLTLSPGTHTIAVAQTQAGGAGTRYVFSNWSDNGAASHSVTVGSEPATYTANFLTQYELTTAASPVAGGTAAPVSGSYYDSGAQVNLTASADSGFSFAGWTGAVFTPASPSTSVIMNAPQAVTADFTGLLAPPPPVTAFSPGQGATGVAVTSSLTWTGTAGATSYDVYFGTSSPPPLAMNVTGTSYSPGMAAGVTYYWMVTAKNAAGSTPSAVWSFTTAAPATTGLRFVPVTPCRVMDTRGTAGTFGGPSLAGGSTRNVPIPQSACNIPATAQAYSLNVTVVPPGPLTYLSIWPQGEAQPVVSTLNSFDGRIVANAAIVPAGPSGPGGISLFASNTTDAIVDINGYFVPASTPGSLSFYAATPCRVADTRNAAGPFGGPYLSGGSTRSFTVPSSSCGIPSTAQAYSLNITAVPHGSLGYLTIWPSGQAQPYVSTLNSANGSVVANAAIVPAGGAPAGAVSVFVTNDSDVIIDINGYFAPPGSSNALSLYSLTPCRVADTRGAAGAFGGPGMAANATRSFAIPASACVVPATAQAYSLNVTVVPPGALAYLTAWPAGQAQPVVSTLNSFNGAVVANAALVPAGTSGAVSIFVSNATDVILDINAYFAQ